MRETRRIAVLFVAAAGPKIGFGHLVRCGVIADALGGWREIALEATPRTRAVARRLGWTVHPAGPATLGRRLPDLVVIDDPAPSRAAAFARHARRLGVAVASVHDGGSALREADVSIDGSLLAARHGRRSPADLRGPAFAVLHRSVSEIRQRPVVRARRRVLIALGGGAHVRAFGVDLAALLASRAPDLAIDVAAGFVANRATAALPHRARWLVSPRGLAAAIARATVVVSGGGVTLYEAAALGAPTVALAVVPAQRRIVRAFAAAGAALAVTGARRARAIAATAEQTLRLLADPAAAARLGDRGRQVIDGGGAARVARTLRQLARRRGGWRHAA